MSNRQETLDLILRYLHDRYPDKYRHMTTELIHMQPYHKQIWAWWEALAHYRMNGYFSSLEQAPDGLKSMHVTENGVINNYSWIDGKYVYIQQWTKKFCEDVYGNRVPGTY